MQHTDKAIAEFEAWWDRQPHSEQFEDLKQQFCSVAVAFYEKALADSVKLDGIESVHHQLGMVCLNFNTTEQTRDFARACRAVIAAGVTVRG